MLRYSETAPRWLFLDFTESTLFQVTPDGTKLLPEPMSTLFYVAIWLQNELTDDIFKYI